MRSRNSLSFLLGFLLLAATVLAGCAGDGTNNDLTDVATTDDSNAPAAPLFQLEGLSGQPVALSDYKGSVVLLNFWATWCPPCKEEMPFFTQLRKKYAARGFEVVGISVDSENPKEVVPQFVSEYGIAFPIAYATPEVVQDYDIEGLPATCIINRNGKIVEILAGGQPLEVFETLVTKHLQGK